MHIVRAVAIDRRSVLVHCSDGWDRTPQLTSLSMLMLDPYYRTIEGFIVLIEKEWLSFGHKFAHRLGWTVGGHTDKAERSPVFIQWLDCVHQCLRQRPEDYEFNEALLLFIANNLYSGKYGNFMFNNERERVTSIAKYLMLSMWTSVLTCQSQYTNPLYKRNPSISCPVLLKPRIVVWEAFFIEYSSKLYNAAWLSNYYGDGEGDEDGGHGDNHHHNRRSSAASSSSHTGYGEEGEDNSKGGSNPLFKLFASRKGASGGASSASLSPQKVSAKGGKWAEDHAVNGCTRCNANFSPFKRRHHCRNCGLIFCGRCSNQTRIVDSVSSWKQSRVCMDCAFKLDRKEARRSIPRSSGASAGASSIGPDAGKESAQDGGYSSSGTSDYSSSGEA